jgi:hypothetical protein
MDEDDFGSKVGQRGGDYRHRLHFKDKFLLLKSYVII